MEYLELAKFIKEVGVSVGVFMLCFWVVQFIIKNMADKLSGLVAAFERFAQQVAHSHENSDKHHEAIMSQHKEIMECLGRINGYHDK